MDGGVVQAVITGLTGDGGNRVYSLVVLTGGYFLFKNALIVFSSNIVSQLKILSDRLEETTKLMNERISRIEDKPK